MQLPARDPALFTAILCLSAALAVFALWIFSHAHTPFDYMVVGTLAAAAGVAAAFVVAIKRRWL